MAFSNLRLSELHRELAEHAEQGRVDQTLAESLFEAGFAAPIECDVLDYKETLGQDKVAQAKLVRAIVAFYNSYGGYIILGIRETVPETEFSVVGIEPTLIDIKATKDLLRHYTGEAIQISSQIFHVTSTGGDAKPVVVIHVPKRKGGEPLSFGRDGPAEAKPSRQLFHRDDTYFREACDCLPAKGSSRFRWLSGARAHPAIDLIKVIGSAADARRIYDHNLPDKSFVCPTFVGRDEILGDLWKWLGDDFVRVRLLAGEGGLGKTSIAYEFARSVCLNPPDPINKVIWLTAKQRQFRAIEDTYVEMPETHFSTFEELLAVLSSALGRLPDEVQGASVGLLKRYLRESLELFPSLIVVDDVDSLDPDDQRKVFETAQALGVSKSRFLLTTRVRQVFSQDTTIRIEGLRGEDYERLASSLATRYLPTLSLNRRQIESMEAVTGGSPLFTESLFRLFRFDNFDTAIASWRGSKGEAVRHAAVRREIEHLAVQSKRTLLACSLLGSASKVELREATALSDDQLDDALSELSSLFLVSAPRVTAEPRYEVPENTRQLVLRTKTEIVNDAAQLESRIKSLRAAAYRPKGANKGLGVGAAINQAISQSRQGQHQDASETLAKALKRNPDHPDLLSAAARIYSRAQPADHEHAIRLARHAFQQGCRRPELFDVWFESETALENRAGMLEVSAVAIEILGEEITWLLRKATAHVGVALQRAREHASDAALREYWQAATYIRRVVDTGTADQKLEARQFLFHAHDAIWRVSADGFMGMSAALRQLDQLFQIYANGDYRIMVLSRICDALEDLVGDFRENAIRNKPTHRQSLSSYTAKVLTTISDQATVRPNDERVRRQLERAHVLEGRVKQLLSS